MGAGAKAASALAYLTRSGSHSTRISPRGHAFEFSTYEEEPTPEPLPPPEQPSRLAALLQEAREDAARAKDDLRWMKERLRLVRDVALAGDLDGAAWLCDSLGSLPTKIRPGSNPVLAATWVAANVDEKAAFRGKPVGEALAKALADLTRLTKDGR